MPSLRDLLAELRRRRVFHAAAAYVAAALLVIEGAGLILGPLGVGDAPLRVLVLAAILGFPLVIAFAWAYDLTASGLRRTDGGPTPDAPLPVRRQLQIFGLFVLASVVTVGATALVVHTTPEARPVDRMALAVFPFRAIGGAVEDWAEGAPDLLATVLDGTALRVADPWSLWRPLRPTPGSRPVPPSPAEAARLAGEAGAGRYLLGSVVDGGDSVTVSVRLYEVGREDPVHVFPVTGLTGDLASAVRLAAVGVLGRLASEDATRSPPELAFGPTESPAALKAYLAAREAMRRGLVDSASTAIDRAIALDSTFVLALVDATVIKSWLAHVQGAEFAGLLRLLDAAAPFADSANERTRLRLAASRASVLTDGPGAMAAARRILEMDSTDLQAWAGLSYYLASYGWQAGEGPEAAVAAAERVVRLDSTYVPGLVARANLAVRLRDPDDARAQLRRLLLADTTSPLARGTLAGLRVSLAGPAEFEAMMPELLGLPRAALPALIRHLRDTDLDRTRRFLRRLEDDGGPDLAPLVAREIARVDMARGWPGRVDSLAQLPSHRADFRHLQFRALLVAASLAGMNPGDGAAASARALADFVPVDSAGAYFQVRPVWLYGWLVGAWNAAFGDTLLARRWEAAFDTMPVGGSPPRWGAGLAADIDARLAARRGDADTALDRARDAFRLWSIHTENTSEIMPEPAMRLNLAVHYQDVEMADSARALLLSLVPPTGWFGFLTPRAQFELGSLDLAAGDPASARLRLERALEAWGDGGPAAAEWRALARRRLQGELGGRGAGRP